MGRRRRRMIRVVKKRLPTVFVCPRCGEEAVKVQLNRGGNAAVVRCGACGLKDEFEASPALQVVDFYNMFCDKVYSSPSTATAIPAE